MNSGFPLIPIFALIILSTLLYLTYSRRNNSNNFHLDYFMLCIISLIASTTMYFVLISKNDQPIYIFSFLNLFHLSSIAFFCLHVESAIKGYKIKIASFYYLSISLFVASCFISSELLTFSTKMEGFMFFKSNEDYSVEIVSKLVSILMMSLYLIRILIINIPKSIFVKEKFKYSYWVMSFIFMNLLQSLFNNLNYFNFFSSDKNDLIFTTTRVFAFLSFTILASNPSIIFYLPNIRKSKSLIYSNFSSDERVIFIIMNEELYLDLNCSLKSLSKKMNISERKISAQIFLNSGKSFVNFMNDLRIEKSIEYINNNFLADYTTIALGEKCGFNSHQSFCRSFQRNTGTTPKKYSTTLFSS